MTRLMPMTMCLTYKFPVQGSGSVGKNINALSEAVVMLEPLLAKFNGVFDRSCGGDGEAVSVAYSNLGDRLDAMSKSSIVTKNDPQTQAAMGKASKASKTIGRVADTLEKKGDCESSPTFTRDGNLCVLVIVKSWVNNKQAGL